MDNDLYQNRSSEGGNNAGKRLRGTVGEGEGEAGRAGAICVEL